MKKDAKDVLVVVQARLNSQRLDRKMLRPFAGTSLFEIALEKLTKLTSIPKENIFVSIYEEELKGVARRFDVNVYHRSYESANNDNDLQTIYEWHDKLPFKYVIKVNGCSPLLRATTIDTFIEQFLSQKEESLFGVIPIKDYFWDATGHLITPWPEDQTIMNTKAVGTTFKAAHVLYASRMDLISKDTFMGDFKKLGDVKLYPVDEVECFDIDYGWQFNIAEMLYKDGGYC